MELEKLTGVDEELIGNSGVIYVVDGAGKQSGEDFQISKHSLDENKKARVVHINYVRIMNVTGCADQNLYLVVYRGLHRVINYLQSRCGEQDMGGLDHICSMNVVVVGHVCMVMILQRHREGDERVHWYLEGLQQVTFLQQHIIN